MPFRSYPVVGRTLSDRACQAIIPSGGTFGIGSGVNARELPTLRRGVLSYTEEVVLTWSGEAHRFMAGNEVKPEERFIQVEGSLARWPEKAFCYDNSHRDNKEPRLLVVERGSDPLEIGKPGRIRVQWLDSSAGQTVAEPEVVCFFRPFVLDVPQTGEWRHVPAAAGDDHVFTVTPPADMKPGVYTFRVAVCERGVPDGTTPLSLDALVGVIDPAAGGSLGIFTQKARDAFVRGESFYLGLGIKTVKPIPAGTPVELDIADPFGQTWPLARDKTPREITSADAMHFWLNGSLTSRLAPGRYTVTARLASLTPAQFGFDLVCADKPTNFTTLLHGKYSSIEQWSGRLESSRDGSWTTEMLADELEQLGFNRVIWSVMNSPIGRYYRQEPERRLEDFYRNCNTLPHWQSIYYPTARERLLNSFLRRGIDFSLDIFPYEDDGQPSYLPHIIGSQRYTALQMQAMRHSPANLGFCAFNERYAQPGSNWPPGMLEVHMQALQQNFTAKYKYSMGDAGRARERFLSRPPAQREIEDLEKYRPAGFWGDFQYDEFVRRTSEAANKVGSGFSNTTIFRSFAGISGYVIGCGYPPTMYETLDWATTVHYKDGWGFGPPVLFTAHITDVLTCREGLEVVPSLTMWGTAPLVQPYTQQLFSGLSQRVDGLGMFSFNYDFQNGGLRSDRDVMKNIFHDMLVPYGDWLKSMGRGYKQVAIYYSRTAGTLASAKRIPPDKQAEGIWIACMRAGFPADYITDEQLLAGAGEGYKVVFAPGFTQEKEMPAPIRDALQGLVRKGQTVIVEDVSKMDIDGIVRLNTGFDRYSLYGHIRGLVGRRCRHSGVAQDVQADRHPAYRGGDIRPAGRRGDGQGLAGRPRGRAHVHEHSLARACRRKGRPLRRRCRFVDEDWYLHSPAGNGRYRCGRGHGRRQALLRHRAWSAHRYRARRRRQLARERTRQHRQRVAHRHTRPLQRPYAGAFRRWLALLPGRSRLLRAVEVPGRRTNALIARPRRRRRLRRLRRRQHLQARYRVRAQCNLQAVDSRGNRIAELSKQWAVLPGASREIELVFDAKLDDYVPPIELSCDFISASINATVTLNRRIPVPTMRDVLDDFSQVTDLWRGANAILEKYTEDTQPVFTFDGDTTATRVDSDQPFGRFALEWKYAMAPDRDDLFYAQFMSGAPISMSVWVKGDGSGNRLYAGTRDWGHRIRGGHSQSEYFLHDLGSLNFTDWRQITFDLPGAGVGAFSPMGGRRGEADYPLEFVGFSIRKGGDNTPAGGTIRIGTITIDGQAPGNEALAVTIAAKEDDGLYRPGPDAAFITAHNSHLTRPRAARLTWTLRSRDGKELAAGGQDMQLGPAAHRLVAVNLPDAPPGSGPVTLTATLADKEDPTAVASGERVLSVPNAMKTWSFDETREYSTYIRAFLWAPPQMLADVPGSTPGPVAEGGSGRKCVPLNWARKADQPVSIAPLMIDPALPGYPAEISVDVFGDGSGVSFYPLFCDSEMGSDDSYCSQTAVIPGSVRIDFTGWRRLTFRAPVVHKFWQAETRFRRHHINYPLNLYLMALADEQTKGNSGRLLLDDLRVETQLPAADTLDMRLALEDQSDLIAPGRPIRIRLANCGLTGSRTVKLDARLAWPDGAEIARVQQPIELPAGKDVLVDLAAKGLPRGAYWLSVDAADAVGRAAIHRALVVMEPKDLGPDATWPASFNATVTSPWPEVVLKADALKRAVGEFRELVALDWDLLEPIPQNFHLGSMIHRLKDVRAGGGTTRMTLGFSAHWAAGEGREQLRRGQYTRPLRDIGHDTDYWHVPEDITDWDNYVYRLARDAGEFVDIWQFWNNPDVDGPLRLSPEVAVSMLKSVRKWTRRYSPASRIMLSGLNVSSAPAFLKEIDAAGGADAYDIVNVKINPGVHPPEIWRLTDYITGLQAAAPGKQILLSEMDWPVEPPHADGSGFNMLDQAVNLSRTAILCHWLGIEQPIVRLSNEDDFPTGTGLTYRLELGMSKRMTTPHMVPRPAYLALMNLRRALPPLKPYASVEMDDLIPGTTRVLIYTAANGAAVIMWRVEGTAALMLPGTLAVKEALNIYGSPIAGQPGTVRVSQTPVLLSFPGQSPETVHAALLGAELNLDGLESKAKAMALRDRVLPAVKLSADEHKYAAEGGRPAKAAGIVPGLGSVDEQGIGGITSESFELACPADSDMVLRRRYLLEGKGSTADVIVNGKSAGSWNLAHTRAELQGGIRDAFFIVPRSLLDKAGRQKIELRYAPESATTFSVAALSLEAQAIPLNQLAPIYAGQAAGVMSLGRNVVGDVLKVGTREFQRGIGTHAWSVIEYPINKQFKSFRVLAGVDACSDGRGSVKFEILGDGRTLSSSTTDPKTAKLAKTATLTGLSAPVHITVDVTGVDRLTLVVHDADDGNREDAADWLEPELLRAQ